MCDTTIPHQDLISAPGNEKTSPWTILQVEDNPANASLVQDLIARRDDLALITAVTGYQGIKIASSYHPDLILMNIRLFDLNGFAALERLKDDPSTANIPVIALSSNARQDDIEKGRKAGFFRYLSKPFKIIELMAAIDSALELVALGRQTNIT